MSQEESKLTPEKINSLKAEYAHILVDEILLSPDTDRYIMAWKRINEIDRTFKEHNLRTVITISTEERTD